MVVFFPSEKEICVSCLVVVVRSDLFILLSLQRGISRLVGYSVLWGLGNTIFFFLFSNLCSSFSSVFFSIIFSLMEDLTKNWSKFSLSKKENTGFALLQTQKSKVFVVAAKFLPSRFLVVEALVRTFKQLWRSQNGFKI